MARLHRDIGEDERIRVLPISLNYRETLTLYASCDVYVSLHRSEGLGLVPLECMLLGKPVIATAWSGNMSYMNHRNSCLVGYDLVDYSGVGADGRFKLRSKVRWANPRVEEAAAWMRRLVYDEMLREHVGRKAMEDGRTYNEQAKAGQFLEEIEQIAQEKAWLKASLKDKEERLDRLKKLHRKEEFRGLKGLKKRIRREMDRHLLWRFQGWR